MTTDDWKVVSRRRTNLSSKEDDLAKISSSIFVTNFPTSFTAKDLFQTCKVYGHVVDSYIPFKKSKTGKRFGFVRFINVFNLERLVNNLCTIWVGNLKLHANVARFQRPSRKAISSVKNVSPIISSYGREVKADHVLPSKGNVEKVDKSFAFVLNSCHLKSLAPQESSPAIEKLINHAGVLSWFSELGNVNKFFASDIRLVWIAIEGLPDDSLPYKKICLSTKVSSIINNRIKVVVKGKVHWIRIWELEAWSLEFDDEFCESSDDDSVDEDKKSPFVVHSQEKSSEDPFGIYNILNKENKNPVPSF
ncbi:RNA-directed DNA polymerase, eukaryota [Tanacetum coccineum]